MNVAIIPARGGSVRVPRKNIRLFRGEPMLCYPIEAAKTSKLFQLIVVSTDDDEIEQVAIEAGAVVMRRQPDNGTKGTQEIARDVLLQLPNAHFACVIYPCSPLLLAADLARGAHVLQGHTYAMSTGPDGADAGCFYWGSANAFREGLPLDSPLTKFVPLPEERCIDINTPEDWRVAESKYDALRRAP